MAKTVYTSATRAGVHDDLDAGIAMKVIAKRRGVPYGTVRRWKTEGRPAGDEYSSVGPYRADPEHGQRAGIRGPYEGGHPLSEQPAHVRVSHEQLDEHAAPLARTAALKLLRYLAGEEEEVFEASELPAGLLEDLPERTRKALALRAWNPSDARAAAQALASLLDKIPDVLSLHDRTRPSRKSGVDGDRAPLGADDLAALFGALGDPDDEGEE